MRRSSEGRELAEAGDDRRLVHRGGVLQSDEQRSEGDAGQAAVTIDFLIAFTRSLIRNNPSEDSIFLALHAAAAQANITRAQAEAFIKAVMMEKEKSPWPLGFF